LVGFEDFSGLISNFIVAQTELLHPGSDFGDYTSLPK
jgi:hypothetical protein